MKKNILFFSLALISLPLISNGPCCSVNDGPCKESPVQTMEERLFEAIDQCNCNRVKELLLSCSNVDCRDEEGMTPLMLAIAQNAFIFDMNIDMRPIVRMLIEQGADTCVTIIIQDKTYTMQEFADLCCANCKMFHDECQRRMDNLCAENKKDTPEYCELEKHARACEKAYNHAQEMCDMIKMCN